MALADEKYMLLTTFRRDTTPVSTPVWLVPLDHGELGFWTSSESGKAKRLKHTDRVTVQPCDSRGRIKAGTEAVGGTGRLVAGAELAEIETKVKAKYGFMTTVSKLLGTIGGVVKRHRVPYGDRGVIVTLAS